MFSPYANDPTMINCEVCGWSTTECTRLVCEVDGAVLCEMCAHLHAAHMIEQEG